ncbi:hypothetical protein PybrP1_001515 [[Pythium] brassicae (nom. inval.)]|nr:hypothetical protein PybrP1_001515 [[Pythium] brassicae (nom. inval.)]
MSVEAHVSGLVAMVSVSIDMQLGNGKAAECEDAANSDASDTEYQPSEPSADEVFAAAAQGLLEGIFVVVMLTSNARLERDGDLQFPLDREAPAHDKDPHAAALSSKSRLATSTAMAHMVRNGPGHGNSRSPSRASSRAASRFGGTASLRSSALAMKLAKLSSFQPGASSPARASSDGFRIVPWGERSEADSHDICETASTLFVATNAAPASSADVFHWPNTPDYAALGSLAGSSSRVPVDVSETQRREAIATDLDARERRQRIARAVRRKGELKLKLRSLADPAVSLEREEATLALAAARTSGSRGLQPSGSTAAIPIPENATFRQEDYDELQSEVVVLDPSGDVLVGENCFLVVKKPRGDLLLDLFQKSSVEPRVSLPLLRSEPQDAVEAADAQGPTASMLSSSPERQPSRQRSPDRTSKSRKGLRRQSTGLTLQDALFDGERGAFVAFPSLAMDPATTPLAKGVTIRVDEAAAAAAARAKQMKPPLQQQDLDEPEHPLYEVT